MDFIDKAQTAYDTAVKRNRDVIQGYEQLCKLHTERQAECDAALKNWNKDRSTEALEKLQLSRSQLETVRELMEADVQNVAEAEADLEFYKARLTEATVVEETILLSAALSRQQEYFRSDFDALQKHMLEIVSKLDHTRRGWEAMHTKAHTLAREAGVPLSRIQKLMEAHGYDSYPIALVLGSNNVMGLDRTTQRQFEFPDAVDGSDLAQQVRSTLVQFVNRPAEERMRARAQQELIESDRIREVNRQRIREQQEVQDKKVQEARNVERINKLKAKRREEKEDKDALEQRSKLQGATITYSTIEEDGDEE